MSNDPMLEMFIYENMQLTERLEEILMEVERLGLPSDEHINEIFRIMHTIKGSAAMMEYDSIASLGHSVEDMFFYIREHADAQPNWTYITDYCLESADFFKQEVAKIQNDLPSDGDPSGVISRINAYMDILTGKVPAPAEQTPAGASSGESGGAADDPVEDDAADETDEDEAAEGDESEDDEAGEDDEADETDETDGDAGEDESGEEAPASGTVPAAQGGEEQNRLTVRVFFEEGCKMENIRAYQITNALEDFCTSIETTPPDLLEDCSDEIIRNGAIMRLVTSSTVEKIKNIVSEALFVRSFEVISEGADTADTEAQAAPVVEEVPAAAETAPEAAAQPPASPKKKGKKKGKTSATKPESAAAEASQPAVRTGAGPVVTADEPVKKTAPAAKPAASAPVSAPAGAPASPAAPAPASPQGGAAAPAAQVGEAKQSFISVNVDKLDKLMDLAGELVISVSMVVNSPDLAGLQLENFEKSSSLLMKNTSELQDVIMSVRMIPISSTFHKMHRIVRDVSRKLGKDVEFVILGEETEVDKNIIDNLSDPLMHIIRNSMDHGLEDSGAEREAAGKSPTGRIVLEARNSGSDVIISCTDDGRGFDRDAILRKATAQGLLTRPENEYTDKEIYNFIMLPGFSTNEEVTELSGRGVGMDVVKKNIEKIGGAVLLDSVPGKGSTVTIRIPLTLAILAGIEIQVGKNFYQVPTLNIRESFKSAPESIVIDPDGNEMILFRGECFPIVRLHQLFGVDTEVTSFEDGIMIMVEDEGRMVGLFADRLVGEQQVVVKPIPSFITNRIGSIRGIAGCTILGNGNISLIVDVKSLTE